MYQLLFEKDGKVVEKTARNEKEVVRLVYAYTSGNQYIKQLLIDEVIGKKPEPEIKEKISKSKKQKES